MTSIVLSIVNLAASAVFDNICDRIANRLTHGDCTDEKCRQMIVRELDEIKTKLDGLARKDLLSSVCFVKDGLCSLDYSFESTKNKKESNEDEHKLNYVKECLEIDGDQNHESPWNESNEDLHSKISILHKALKSSPQTQTVRSKERLISAKSSFEIAYSKATEAFNNESLSTTERILAAKLRVASKILQCLEDPPMAIAFCKLYLQQLHELPAVRKRFAVFSRGKVKSHLSKKKRASNIRCVMELNYALYEYARSFAKTGGLEMLAGWPKIKLRRKSFNPLLVSNKILKKMVKCGLRSPNQFPSKEFKNSECFSINSKGEIIVKYKNDKGLRMFSNDRGEIVESFCSVDLEASKTHSFEILALAVSLDDEVYVVARYKADKTFYYNLYILDADLGRVQQQVSLGCLTGAGEVHHKVCLAVDSNKNIFVTKQDDATVFVFDRDGRPKNNFSLQNWNLIKDLKISATGEVVAAELVGKTVGIYTDNGSLRQDITVPGLHKVSALAIDYIDNTVLVLTEVLTSGCFHEYRLLSFSESGELAKTLILPRQKENAGYRISSHPSGPLAVVHEAGVIFLHH